MAIPARPSHVALLALLLGGLPACQSLSEALRGKTNTPSAALLSPPAAAAHWSDADWGAYLALWGDFGTLTTDNLRLGAVPWKVLMALPEVVPEPFYGSGPRTGQPLRRFGLLYDVQPGGQNASSQRVRAVVQAHGPAPFHDAPVGYARGVGHRSWPSVTLELAAANCSACHAGRGFDAAGSPTEEAIWGLPNHSLDFDALTDAVVTAVQDPRATDAALLAAIRRRDPAISTAELDTLRKHVLPGLRQELKEDLARWGSVHPWRLGGPGFAHGAAILRESLSPDRSRLRREEFPAAMLKVANIYGVTGKGRILVDGSYVADPKLDPRQRFLGFLVGFLPVLGTPVDECPPQEPQLRKLAAFLTEVAPPPFPGPIDAEQARRGAAIYDDRCSNCHGDLVAGRYQLPEELVPLEKIGTDPTRSQALDAGLLARFNGTVIGRYMKVVATGAYMAPTLRGVWGQAPYLHNGSVPTLWHLLTPAERPVRFLLGGHRLDLRKVGVELVQASDGSWLYREDHRPWSTPRLYDTREPGRSNRGHETQVAGLSEANKWDLIEYLKTL